MTLAGAPYRPRSTSEAIARGVAFVPEDRRKLGLFTAISVCRNLTVVRLKDLEVTGCWRVRRNNLAHELVHR